MMGHRHNRYSYVTNNPRTSPQPDDEDHGICGPDGTHTLPISISTSDILPTASEESLMFLVRAQNQRALAILIGVSLISLLGACAGDEAGGPSPAPSVFAPPLDDALAQRWISFESAEEQFGHEIVLPTRLPAGAREGPFVQIYYDENGANHVNIAYGWEDETSGGSGASVVIDYFLSSGESVPPYQYHRTTIDGVEVEYSGDGSDSTVVALWDNQGVDYLLQVGRPKSGVGQPVTDEMLSEALDVVQSMIEQ